MPVNIKVIRTKGVLKTALTEVLNFSVSQQALLDIAAQIEQPGEYEIRVDSRESDTMVSMVDTGQVDEMFTVHPSLRESKIFLVSSVKDAKQAGSPVPLTLGGPNRSQQPSISNSVQTVSGEYMLIQLSRQWWWLALRGITMILFGILAFAWRGDTPGSFMLLFGGFVLADGLLAIFIALTNVTGNKRWWIVLHGLVSIDIAVFSFIWAESAATLLLYLMAAWALITGLVEGAGAVRLARYVSNERLLRWSGLASIMFAVLIWHFLRTDGLSVARMIGPSAIIFGLLTLALSLNTQNMGKFACLLSQ